MPSVLDNLQGSDQIPNQKYQPPTHVPTSFAWTAEWGVHVCIAGSFDPPIPTWTPIEMPGNKVTLDLLPGKKYYYKFVIDGNWVTQPGQPTTRDESGNENHEIQVELPPPPPPPSEEEEVIVEKGVEEVNEEQHQVVEDHNEEELKVVDNDHHKEHQHQEEQFIADEHQHEEEQVIADEHQHQEEQVIADEHQHQEEQVIADEHQHQEEQVMADEHQHQEEQVIADEHQHEEEQVIADEHQHQEEQVIADEHQHQEEQIMADEHQHQVVVDEHHEQIVVDEQVEYHHQEESHHEEEDQHHHEDESTNVRIEEQHGDTVVSESTSEQKEETETKIISSETIEEETTETKIINNETIGQNEAFMSNGSTSLESSTIVKETIIGSDDDKLSTEHVVNNIEETHDDSIATETNETLSTSQNDTEPTVNLSSGPAVTNENIEVSYELTSEETTLDKDKEISIITTGDLVIESEVISLSTGEHTAKETVISSTSEAELSIDATSAIDSENKAESENVDDTHPSKTIETHKLGFEDDDYDYGGENITTETTEDLNEETLKEVILNNTWTKDESYSYDENSLSQWTESHKPNPLVWPENVHLQWSDIDKSEQVTGSRSDGTTIISEEIETSNKPEIEVEGNSEHTFKETFTTSNDESSLKEVQSNEIPSTLSEQTIINQAESSLNNSFESTTVVESYMEHKTNESVDETGINTTVTTSEFGEKVVVEQFEKPESSATADGTSVKAPVFEQHKHLSESLQENQSIPTGINVPCKIISISPNISSPGESTRNADLYTHNINVATNMSKESTNTKSKHKKPVVEISTSREILKRDTRLKQQHGDELDKIDINLIYLVTSLATTFTLGIISMLYRSVFGTKK